MGTDVTKKPDDGIVEISGRAYLTVARRLKDFWHERPDWSIETELMECGEYVRIRAVVKDADGRLRATGHGEENRDQGNINRTSAIENCETGAVGRALGVLGYTGSAIASAEEMQAALERQREFPIIEHMAKVREHFESIAAIKTHLLQDEYSSAYEAWSEIPHDDKPILWRAPTKGGIFTTEERGKMKSDQWNEAMKAHHSEDAA